MLTAFVTGFATGFSLILAIGAQNAYVLRQGLMQAHVFWICMICALSDAAFITMGIVGASSIGAAFPRAVEALIWVAVVFLTCYGALSLRRAMQPRAMMVEHNGPGSLRVAVLTSLALSWLNPHVYLDTVGLIGAISTGFAELQARAAYGLGAVVASFVFFFSLGYGARLLVPFFRQPRAWAILDVGIALVMWSIAAGLAFGA